MKLSAPAPIAGEHDSSDFFSGQDSLDFWLRRRALSNQTSGGSRTFVVCEGAHIRGYYAVASGGLAVADAIGKFRCNMPDPIPVAIVARLAVDKRLHGRGIGRALFQDAALRIVNAAGEIGIRGLVAHALKHEAVAFYGAIGLDASPTVPRTLMITLADLKAAL